MPQFDTTFFAGQVFWMLISFGFLYLMMAALICPMIDEVLSERQRQVNSYLDQATLLNQQADAVHQRLQIYHLETEQQVNNRLQNAYTELEHEAQKIESKNDKSLRQKIKKVEQTIATTNDSFTQQANPLIHKMAKTLVKKLTEDKT